MTLRDGWRRRKKPEYGRKRVANELRNAQRQKHKARLLSKDDLERERESDVWFICISSQ